MACLSRARSPVRTWREVTLHTQHNSRMLSGIGVWDRCNQPISCSRPTPTILASLDCPPFTSQQLMLRFVKNCSQGGRREETTAQRNSSNAWITHLCHSITSAFGCSGEGADDPNHVLQRTH